MKFTSKNVVTLKESQQSSYMAVQVVVLENFQEDFLILKNTESFSLTKEVGKSKPHTCLEDNTTWHLVQDIESIRKKLEIDKWLVFGGSWGSTLALAYAQKHPDCVSELVLRGIFMLREKELKWFYQYGASEIYPEAWQGFLNEIPKAEHSDLIEANRKIFNGADEEKKLSAAKAWTK